ncbi:MAG: nitrate reductase gamma subunit, partial [Cyanobacteriota bacterium erpe_2018_sw_21hr_WHONDRS-SW48-000092_B_bin.40]|nr:nitrate reductase gamma subunit [Cyanobacteriota bacterium erpe_2018_sw_21hr_WHONDRS-SW48-000092_B_bin.40]
MSDTILFVALPYLALFICVFGSIYRIRTQPFSYSSLSSQFLESKGLMWGSLPWHIGITVILLAHVVAFLVPGLWQSLMSNQTVLMAVESIGLGLSFLCLLGLIVLAVRRLTSSKVQAVTSTMDLVVIFLLLLQVGLGAAIAVHCRWGSSWCSGTTTPYLWSILLLQPDTTHIHDLPLLVKAHIVSAWLFLLVIPFSRLLHM